MPNDDYLTIKIEYSYETISDKIGVWPFTRALLLKYGINEYVRENTQIAKIVTRIKTDNDGKEMFERGDRIKFPSDKYQILKLLGADIPQITANTIRVEPSTSTHKIWPKTRVWQEVNENDFRNKFVEFVIKTAREAAAKRKVIDCADMALLGLIDSAKFFGLKITFPVWSANQGGWINISSEDTDFTTIEQFKGKVTASLKAISIIDRDRMSKKIDKSQLLKGDLIMFDLQWHGNISSPGGESYSGHTVIVTNINNGNDTISVVEGHIGSSFPEIKENKVFSEYIKGLKDEMGTSPQYRRLNYALLFQ